MRRYVVVRTDKGRASFMLREFEQGRLRQGWGWLPSQDLHLLRAKINAGQKLTAEESAAWRNRRLLDTEPDGLKPGDVVVVPNLPEQGRWMIARVAGPYTYTPPDSEAKVGVDYAHVVEVAPVRAPGGKLAVIDPDNENVDARLRSTMRNLSRMWSIDALGAAVEKIITAAERGADTTGIESEKAKQAGVFDAVRAAAWKAVRERYHGAQFEQFVLTLFRSSHRADRRAPPTTTFSASATRRRPTSAPAQRVRGRGRHGRRRSPYPASSTGACPTAPCARRATPTRSVAQAVPVGAGACRGT